MQVDRITSLIETFAPLETQEEWDYSGWIIKIEKDINKILLCLSVTENIINQAVEKNCDIIISHHPLFSVPLNFNKGISIYCAHTNLDKADGGTTDSLIELLFDSFTPHPNPRPSRGDGAIRKVEDFLRLIELEKEMSIDEFAKLVKSKLNLQNLKIVNNKDKKTIKKITFCAGSGMDFASQAEAISDIFVTGDVKYHPALESNVIIADIGHFESEIPVLKKLKNLLEDLNLEVIIADEKSPFINY